MTTNDWESYWQQNSILMMWLIVLVVLCALVSHWLFNSFRSFFEKHRTQLLVIYDNWFEQSSAKKLVLVVVIGYFRVLFACVTQWLFILFLFSVFFCSDCSFIGYRAYHFAGIFSLAQQICLLQIIGGRRSSFHKHIISQAVVFSISNSIFFLIFSCTFCFTCYLHLPKDF